MLAVTLCAATASACLTLTSFRKAAADEAAFESNPFETTYDRGATLDMPSSLNVVSGGTTYTANKSYIRFPDGTTYYGGQYKLNSYGEYTVVYEAEAGGKKITATHTFEVNKLTYSAGEDTSYSIQTLNSDFGADVKGIALNLAAGDTFKYNRPVNIYTGGTLEFINFNVMHFEPVGKEIVITLTDCYDPSVYVDINYTKAVYDETYLKVGANGKTAYGLWDRTRGAAVLIEGEMHYLNNNGTGIPGNRKKERHGLSADRYNNISLSVNSENKDKLRFYVNTRPEAPVNSIISELNNSEIYNYDFGGFTTGEVFVSVTAKTVLGENSVPLEIASLGGVSGEDLAPGLLADTTGPEIVVQSEADSLNVMADVPIAVPSAVAYDTNDVSGEVDYAVYYAYGTDNEVNVGVSGGKFTPEELGEYTVVYTACDSFGNKSEKEFVLNAVKKGKEGIEFSCDKVSGVEAGTMVSFASYQAESLNSTAKVNVTVTAPNGSLAAVGSNLSMLVESVGKYTVTYSYSDDLYSGSYTYEFEAVNGGNSRFESDKIVTPKYMIKGAEYSVAKVAAYQYSSVTPIAAATEYTISYDGGAYVPFDPEKFTVSGASTLKIRYSVSSDDSVFIESDEVKIVDAGYGSGVLNVARYFAGDFEGSVSESASDYISYALGVTSRGALDFVNPLLLSRFSVRYAISKGTKIDSYTFVFTDYYDNARKATLKFVTGGVEVNGVFKTVPDSAVDNAMSVSVNDDGTLMIGSTAVACDFGFTTDKVLFGIEFEDITVAGKFNVYSVCNQTLGYYVTSDNIKPLISVKHPDRAASVGDVIRLEIPEYADVLSPSGVEKCVLSVYKDGKLVSDSNGEQLKNVDPRGGYSFVISEYGSYLILYRYTDGSGKSEDDRFEISVTDIVAPEITLNGYDGKAVSVGVNKEVSPISYSISDNVSARENIKTTVIVYNEKGVVVRVSNDKFTLTAAGKYTVCIYCSDEAGNTAFASYEVIAK